MKAITHNHRFLAVLILLILSFCFFTACEKTKTRKPNELLPQARLKFPHKTITVEVAFKDETRMKGLMFREELPEDSGMLFVFPKAAYHAFYMKNTQIPLSIAFINEQGIIVDIKDMRPYDLSLYRPKYKAKYALEMNQGWFKKNNIKIKNQITFLDKPWEK